MDLHRLAERLGNIERLDQVAEPLAAAVTKAIPHQTIIKDLLSGTWLGHPLHPLLTDIPIGSFTTATVLDLIGGERSRWAADRMVDLGLLSSVATAAAGAADWSETIGEERRVGVVHAAANAVGVGLYGLSAVARRRGRRGMATALGLGGMSVMTVGGYLGGFLGFGRGVGVNSTAFEHRPTEWTDAGEGGGLAEGAVRKIEVDGVGVLLHRRVGGEVVAIASRCTHAGGPLEEGEVDAGACTVTCPWHESVFRLDTGKVVHGPATTPQPEYETRLVDGALQVRAAR